MSESLTAVIIILLMMAVSCLAIYRWPQKKQQKFFIAALLIYVVAVVWETLLFRKPAAEAVAVLNPRFILKLLTIDFNPEGGVSGVRFGLIYQQSWQNILLFIPLGFLLPQVSRRSRRLWRTVLIGTGLSIVIEVTQLITRLGWFDVDDIMLNMLGTLVGYGAYKLSVKIPQKGA